MPDSMCAPPLPCSASRRWPGSRAGSSGSRRAALAEQRTAVGYGIGVDVQLGLDREVIPDLALLVGRHLLREGRGGQLALALYRSGRSADAFLNVPSRPGGRWFTSWAWSPSGSCKVCAAACGGAVRACPTWPLVRLRCACRTAPASRNAVCPGTPNCSWAAGVFGAALAGNRRASPRPAS